MTNMTNPQEADTALMEQQMSEKFVEPEFKEIEVSRAKYISTTFLDTRVWSQMKGMAMVFKESGALPVYYNNTAKVVMAMQLGFEMGMKPMESIKSLYPVNGTFNIWGSATTNRLKLHGYEIDYENETDTQCTAIVRKGKKIYKETFNFQDAVDSGYTSDREGKLKIGWRKGLNRKLKMRYGALSIIIKTRIPEVLGSASDIQEVAEDFEIIESKEIKKVEVEKPISPNSEQKQSALKAILDKKKADAAKAEELKKAVEQPEAKEADEVVDQLRLTK